MKRDILSLFDLSSDEFAWVIDQALELRGAKNSTHGAVLRRSDTGHDL